MITSLQLFAKSKDPNIISIFGKKSSGKTHLCKATEKLSDKGITYIDEKNISDVIQIAEGTYSPITSFMNISEIDSVLTNNKLLNGELGDNLLRKYASKLISNVLNEIIDLSMDTISELISFVSFSKYKFSLEVSSQ